MLEGMSKIYQVGPFAIYKNESCVYSITYNNKIIYNTRNYSNALRLISSKDSLYLSSHAEDILLFIYEYKYDRNFKLNVRADINLYSISYYNYTIETNIPFKSVDECVVILEFFINGLKKYTGKIIYSVSDVKEYYEKTVRGGYKVDEIKEEKTSVNISANIIGEKIKSYFITTNNGDFTITPQDSQGPAKLYKNINKENILLYTSDHVESLISMVVLNKVTETIDIHGLKLFVFNDSYVYKDLYKITKVDNIYTIWNLKLSGKDSKVRHRFENLKDAIDYVKIVLKAI